MRRGWFKIDGVQDGDRELKDQLKGLEAIDFQDRFVLDLGCAEGLIARHAVSRGASLVDGVEIVEAHLTEARRQCGPPCRFFEMDLNRIDLTKLLPSYDVVLMLAILHKLRRPSELLAAVFNLRPQLCVIRLPPIPADGVIIDERSNFQAFDVPAYMERNGYVLERVTEGHFSEWCGTFFRRR